MRSPLSLSKYPPLFANGAAKESPAIFSGDMCGGENTARPANVRAVRRKRTARAMQSGRGSLAQK